MTDKNNKDEIEKKAKELNVPIIPPINVPIDNTPTYNPTVAICGVCGIEMKQIMGYVCPRNDCPCFTRFTC